MSFKIEHLTAFISVDSDGEEGLIGIPVPGSDALCIPAIAADDRRAKDMYPIVKSYCDAMRVEFRVILLDMRTDVTEIYKEKYG